MIAGRGGGGGREEGRALGGSVPWRGAGVKVLSRVSVLLLARVEEISREASVAVLW